MTVVIVDDAAFVENVPSAFIVNVPLTVHVARNVTTAENVNLVQNAQIVQIVTNVTLA